MQVLEVAAIIGLIRRTQSITGRVGVVAGVLGLFRKDRVVAVGGYDPRMATEDIELTWRLLLAGWQTVYEPRALVGMQVPPSLPALWAQRKRWARGQGEVIRVHFREVFHWRNRRMWMLVLESLISLIWIVILVTSLIIAALGVHLGAGEDVFGFALAWGVAIATVATAQLIVALWLQHGYDPTALRALLLGALYPPLYWMLAAAAALRSETVALVRGPREQRVVWDIPREQLDAEVPTHDPS
jgi:poly-beta-1,6-N-acetyl-D-glucosamine synthase